MDAILITAQFASVIPKTAGFVGECHTSTMIEHSSIGIDGIMSRQIHCMPDAMCILCGILSRVMNT